MRKESDERERRERERRKSDGKRRARGDRSTASQGLTLHVQRGAIHVDPVNSGAAFDDFHDWFLKTCDDIEAFRALQAKHGHKNKK